MINYIDNRVFLYIFYKIRDNSIYKKKTNYIEYNLLSYQFVKSLYKSKYINSYDNKYILFI
jgi:hypothetical protein